MLIKAIPRFRAKLLLEDKDFFKNNNLISINDSVELLAVLGLKVDKKSALSLTFADLDPSYCAGYGMFDTEDAERIIDFLDTMDRSKSLIIHCTMGVSRSGAVAEFACDYLKQDRQEFVDNNRHICSNKHVLKTLYKVLDLR